MVSTATRTTQVDTATKENDGAGAALARLVPDFDGPNKDLLIKMEAMLREAHQISITVAIQEVDGGSVFQEGAWV